MNLPIVLSVLDDSAAEARYKALRRHGEKIIGPHGILF